MVTPTKWGTEFPVNTTTGGKQISPDIVALPNGTFVAVWTDESPPTGVADLDPANLADLDFDTLPALQRVRAQVYDADGTRLGEEFVVNTSDYGLQVGPQIAALADGAFLVTWLGVGLDFSSGTFALTSLEVFGQRFDADGSKVGDEISIAEIDAPLVSTAKVAAADGQYAVAWLNPLDPSTSVQILDADGAPVGPLSTLESFFSPGIAGLTNGNFVLAGVRPGTTGQQMAVQIVGNDGAPIAGPIPLATAADDVSDTTVTALADGRFVVAWNGLFGSDNIIRAQLFNADGTLIGEEFAVSSGDLARDPVVTALPDGGFFVSWEGVDFAPFQGGLVPSTGIRGQLFDPDGNKIGAEIIINKTTEERQSSPAAATLADGRIAVVWDDGSQDDPIDDEVRGQILDPRSEAVTLQGGAERDSFVGTYLNDTLKGGRGPDLLFGESGNDMIFGERGKDTIFGGPGNDILYGGNAADWLDGGLGFDTTVGGRGRDKHIVDSLGDTIEEAPRNGKDTVISAEIDLTLKLYENVENARAEGTANLALKGSGDRNKLVGNDGDNIIKGLGGGDHLNGKAGNDIYVFSKVEHSKPTNPDKIVSFEQAADRVGLNRIDAIEGGDDDPFAFIGTSGFSETPGELRVAKGGKNTKALADTDGDGKADFAVSFKGTINLSEADFVL